MENQSTTNLKPPFKKGDPNKPKGGRPKGSKNKPATKADLNQLKKEVATRIDATLNQIMQELKATNHLSLTNCNVQS